ncbi:subtilisin-like protein, partial [Mycena metata]
MAPFNPGIMSTTFLFVASLLAAASAGTTIQNLVVRSNLTGIPQGFSRVGAANDSTVLNLRIALHSSDISGLEKALLDVSTPSSSNYGNHLTKAEVDAFVAPTDAAVAAVQVWLISHNLTAKSLSSAGDWLSIAVPVSRANEMLAAKYETFEHIASGKTYARTLSFSLPAEVADHIADIHPTTTFNNPLSVSRFASIPKTPVVRQSSCADSVTPACLQTLYGIPNTPATQSANSIVVPGFLDQFAQIADLKTFLELYRPDVTNTFTTQLLDGGSNPQNINQAGYEANLNIEYTVGIATNVPVSFVSVGSDFNDGALEGFLDIENFLLSDTKAPQVMTTSYGWNEIDLSKALALKLCQAYVQLGARGTSILFSSGNGGVAGAQRAQCHRYEPTFPSGCPYVTSVSSVHGIAPETASDFSSGGFSNYWPTPNYQASAVAAFLKAQGTTNADRFNASGRGFPDVSSQGENIEFVSGGEMYLIGGTSAACPIFASVIALLNDQLIAAGKKPLGFLNPWLYANPGMLNDVTTGSNPGCDTAGFSARAGWDPITGLGTPNFPKMKAAAG